MTSNEEQPLKDIKNEKLTEDEQILANFKPDQCPPSIKLCMMHQKANRIGMQRNLKDSLLKAKICPCCGYQIDNDQFSLCCNIDDLDFLGVGVPLLFKFIKYGFCFLAIIIIIHGIKQLIDNKNATSFCTYETEGDQCASGISTDYCTQNQAFLNKTQGGLNLLCVAVLSISVIVWRRTIVRVSSLIDAKNVTASDFTIEVKGLPRQEPKEEIQQYFNQQLKRSNISQFFVEKVTQAYDVSQYVDQLSKKNRYVQAEIKLKRKLNSGSNGDQQKLNQIKQLKENAEKQLLKIQNQYSEQGVSSCGIAYITLSCSNAVEYIVEQLTPSALQYLILFIFPCIGSCLLRNYYKGKRIKVKRAPEPKDINWHNLPISECSKRLKRMATAFITLIALAASFGILYLLSNIQTKIKEDNKDDPGFKVKALGIAIGFAISIVNNILGMIIKYLAIYEKHNTFTEYQRSLANKLIIAQFLNGAILIFILNELDNGRDYLIEGGLASDIIMIQIIAAGMPLVQLIFNPFYLLKCCKQNILLGRGQKNNALTQIQANKVFEGLQFNAAYSYAYVIKYLALASLYAYLLPLGVVITAAGIIIFYWCLKYQLLRMNSIPAPLSQDITLGICDKFLNLIILIYTAGNLAFELLLFEDCSVGAIISVILGVYVYIFPTGCCFRCKNTGIVEGNRVYSESKLFLLDDYDRSNPITCDKAMSDWKKQIIELDNDKEKTAQTESQTQSVGQLNQGINFSRLNFYANQDANPFEPAQRNQFNSYQQLQNAGQASNQGIITQIFGSVQNVGQQYQQQFVLNQMQALKQKYNQGNYIQRQPDLNQANPNSQYNYNKVVPFNSQLQVPANQQYYQSQQQTYQQQPMQQQSQSSEAPVNPLQPTNISVNVNQQSQIPINPLQNAQFQGNQQVMQPNNQYGVQQNNNNSVSNPFINNQPMTQQYANPNMQRNYQQVQNPNYQYPQQYSQYK